MAVKRKTRDRAAQIAFDALSIEGGLLSPEWLSKVAQLQAGSQAEADYRVPKGLNLRDEIGRYWRIAQAHWADLNSGREAKADSMAVSERFVLFFLRDALGFTSLTVAEPVILAERSYPIGHEALGGRVPVVIAPVDSGLDTLSSIFGDGSRKRSAFGLTQEYLNAQGGALWGIASDGATLRIMRDNASLTRPAWIEADLQRIFTEERYADFAALWLLCHDTRFGREDQPIFECALEAWRNAGREAGTRAREHLRRGVEEALVALGQGFLSHPENQTLRGDLQRGILSVKDYFNQLLRLVYRLIFLLTVEERGLLHSGGTDNAVQTLYADGYGVRRLRERSVKRSAHDRFSDLWEATKVVFRGLSSGEPRLGLPALSGIFATNQCPALDRTKLENRSLLFAVFKLAWLREGGSLARVNWRDMGPEELGSVYESLLELVPQITADGRQFAFATGGETKGNARKTTGSYYTPDNLVQILLDNALEPIIADTLAKNPGNAVEALLSLSIVDPACGSGHFLLAAARRLAAHVARIQANGTPSTTEYKHALRQVVGRCIFGVDLNPMAVELCKVALWMEAVEPGTPLTFLNSHIRHGNALLGTTPDLMSRGIPDAAWAPIAGDDKKVASALKKRNREEAGGQRTLDFGERRHSEIESEAVMRAFVALDASSDTKFEELTKKEERWGAILDSPEYRHQKFVADAWCASFVWPKQPGELADAAPTNELWRQIRDGQERVSELTENTVAELTEQYQFFHWHLQFPQVFAKGGFDVVLGNPPWDKIQIEEQHFFASTHPEIATADARRRKRLIENLAEEEPTAFARYRLALATTLGTVQLVKAAGSYPLTGKGNVATHALFAELAHSLLASRPECSLALVVPSGLATQDSQKELFAFLIDGRLRLLFDFENSGGLFAEVHRSFRFALVVATAVSNAAPARFSFFLKEPSELHENGRILYIDSSYLQEISPNTRSAPLARTQRDLDILIRICRAGVALRHDEGPSPWGWQSSQMFNETHEADDLVAPSVRLENQGAQLSRLYEAKLLHQFDHRFSTYDDNQTTRYVTVAEHNNPSFLAQTRWFVPSQIWSDRVTARNFGREWVIAFRRIARATDERTFIATVLPRCATGSQTPIGTVSVDAVSAALLLGNLNSFVFDFGVRLRSGGTDLNHFIVNQLFVVSPDRYNEERWRGTAELLKRIVLELTYTAWDLAAFAQDIGYEGPPFRWDLERRFFLRCELDAAFFSLYGLSRDDASYIMDSFPIVYRSDEKAYGYYRTKHVILEIHDAMAEAVRIGNPYQTRLNPPPADPLAAHQADVRGNVVQFGTQSVSRSPMAPGREILAWGPELISLVAVRVGTHATTGRWGTTWQGLDLGMHALAAVLRNLPGPTSREEVERAVVLTILPRLLQSKFDSAAAAAWGHAIGAANMGIKSIASLQIKWDEVLRRAVIEHVLNVDANGEWCAGPDVGDVPSAELDARAIVSLSCLSCAILGGDDIELISQTEALRVA